MKKIILVSGVALILAALTGVYFLGKNKAKKEKFDFLTFENFSMDGINNG